MTSPLAPTHDSDSSDAALVDAAVQGERSAQETAYPTPPRLRPQPGQRMLLFARRRCRRHQRILICIVTNLASVRALRIAPHSREFCGFAHRLPIPFHCPASPPYGRTLLRAMLPVVVNVPAIGSYSSRAGQVRAIGTPTAMSTSPLGNSVAVWSYLVAVMLPVAVNVPAACHIAPHSRAALLPSNHSAGDEDFSRLATRSPCVRTLPRPCCPSP